MPLSRTKAKALTVLILRGLLLAILTASTGTAVAVGSPLDIAVTSVSTLAALWYFGPSVRRRKKTNPQKKPTETEVNLPEVSE